MRPSTWRFAAGLGLLAAVLPATGPARAQTRAGSQGLANPSTVYCLSLGYRSRLVEGPAGQDGECVFPDGTSCPEWSFYRGECAPERSVCARHGLRLEVRAGGPGPWSGVTAFCLREDGSVVGTAAEVLERMGPGAETGR